MSNNDVIYNPPVVVPVQVDPALREAVPLFSGYAIFALEDIPNDNRGPGREQFKMIMQREQGLFAEMVQIIAALTEYLLVRHNQTPNQYNVEAAISQVIRPVVDGFYGLVIDRFSREFEQARTISQQQYDDRLIVQEKLQSMIQEMDHFITVGRPPVVAMTSVRAATLAVAGVPAAALVAIRTRSARLPIRCSPLMAVAARLSVMKTTSAQVVVLHGRLSRSRKRRTTNPTSGKAGSSCR